MRRYVQVSTKTWRFVDDCPPPARSDLPMPHVISDIMPETEHIDGKFYTSKRAFRAVTRANGLTEVGNEKQKPKKRATDLRETKERRKQDVQKAIARYKAGQRPVT